MKINPRKANIVRRGQCQICLKVKVTELINIGTEWRDACAPCQQSAKPYLRETPKQGAAIRVAGIIIGYEPVSKPQRGK